VTKPLTPQQKSERAEARKAIPSPAYDPANARIIEKAFKKNGATTKAECVRKAFPEEPRQSVPQSSRSRQESIPPTSGTSDRRCGGGERSRLRRSRHPCRQERRSAAPTRRRPTPSGFGSWKPGA
jgi:hypothetical protein